MSVFGVDFGNLNTTVAITRHGGVDIVTNEVSKRETTTIASFVDNERFIGEPGLDRYVRNSSNTIFLLKRFIGMYMDDPSLESERRFLTCAIKGDDKGRLMFGVNYCGELTYFYPEQVLAMMLQRLRGYVNLASLSDSKVTVDSRECVLTVPCYYTAEQRKLLMQACEIAGLNCLSLVNDTTAAGIDYGIFRGSSLGETEDKGQVVGILDMGYGTTVFAVACFWRGHLKLLSRTFDRHLGTRDIDYKLFEYMAEEVKKKYHVDVKENKRASLRLLQACERLRYLLSGNQVAQLNVENLMDVDVNIPSFPRSTLEELSVCLVERFKAVIKKGFEESGLSPDQFHSIEMIGGGSRIPMFKSAAEELLGRAPNFTLNASETAARGAAITAAVYSPKFKVREFVVSDIPTYPIKLGYYMENASAVSHVPFLPDINKVVSVQGTDDHYPKVLEITIKRPGGFKLYAFYDSEHPKVKAYLPRKDFVIGEWEIGTQRKDSNATEVRVRVRLLPNGLVSVESAVSVEVYEVEEPADAEEGGKGETANEEGEQPAEKKPMVKKQKQRRVELSVTPRLDVIGLTGQEIVEFQKKETEMNDRDALITKTRDSKNELESYILDNRPRIADGGILCEYVTKEQQAKFIQLANEYENWLYEDGADAELNVYQERVKTLRAIADAASDRRRNFEDVEFELPTFKQEVNKAKNTALAAIGKEAHITEEELRGAAAKCDEALAWAENEMEKYRKQHKSESPVLTCSTLREKQKEVAEAVRAVVKRPPPPKPKEATPEAKDGETAADGNVPPEVSQAGDGEKPPSDDQLD
ncbi:heat shock protein 110, putative [Trypanosoma equiperdum]|uniref:Heat shock protein, putative n=2 Tax=Trypanozoon TaxID=39700 RepID=Q388X2_TRYB2|nr:heat shock protein, putative [Trypanosoma brucei brucei TREU927]EAN78648.1 heat shock protein, putative [Trypanosoma brucei brucei TREU927]SCU64220.1 heat shock protein 110, putative [Trypanosoma equiperdum]